LGKEVSFFIQEYPSNFVLIPGKGVFPRNHWGAFALWETGEENLHLFEKREVVSVIPPYERISCWGVRYTVASHLRRRWVPGPAASLYLGGGQANLPARVPPR